MTVRQLAEISRAVVYVLNWPEVGFTMNFAMLAVVSVVVLCNAAAVSLHFLGYLNEVHVALSVQSCSVCSTILLQHIYKKKS